MTVAAVIQARMGSSRLPGKVLLPLAGKPILWHVVHRLRKCVRVDRIAIATTTLGGDDPIEEFARAEGITLVRGPEDDVLARFAMAADVLEADVILRVTGDAPLVDPKVADLLIGALEDAGAGYATYAPEGIAIDEGFSPLTRRALDRLCEVAGDDPVAREHVTAYFKKHPDFVRVATITPPAARVFDARLSVDTPADLEFLEAVYRELGAAPGEADVEQVVALLRRRPDLLEINRHVHQKGAGEKAMSVLIRCDGGPELGLGHVVRCVALADALRDRHGAAVRFAVTGDFPLEMNYPMDLKPAGPGADEDQDEWLLGLVESHKADVLVADVRSGPGGNVLVGSTLERVQAHGCLVAVIDDPDARRLAADLGFYPPVPTVFDLDWSGFKGTLHTGWRWVILRPQFAARRHRAPEIDGAAKVLIAMGGADPAGLGLRTLEALSEIGDDIEMHVIAGAANVRWDALKERADGSGGQVTLRRNVTDMAGLMAEMDLAVAAFGVTAYELAALGVPSLYLCLNANDVTAAGALVDAGAGENLGLHTDLSDDALKAAVENLIGDPDRRAKMQAAGPALGLGQGAQNVAQEIAEAISSSSS